MIKRLLSGLRIQKREEHPGSLFIPNTFPRDGLEMELFFVLLSFCFLTTLARKTTYLYRLFWIVIRLILLTIFLG